MMELFDRLKRARIFQVLAFYVGASWVILQVVDILQDSLALPDWVAPVAVILLMIGLVIIAATAMIQSSGAAAAPAMTAGGDDGVATRDDTASPASEPSPAVEFLTWKRSITGGAVAFLALFIVAGMAVTLGGGSAIGPQEIAADEAGVGVAVLPFTVNGPDMDVWAEGMVDLLADNLDGTGGMRAIDPRTVMSRWRGRVEDGESPDLPEMLDIAESTGARYAVVGSAVSIGGTVRLTTDIYDVLSGDPIGSGAAEGESAEVMALVDRLSVETAGAVLRTGGGDGLALRHTTDLTTQSPTALRAYLEGEALYRRANFAGATDAFRRAVAEDSTFALANLRLSRSIGWLRNIGDDEAQQALVRARDFSDRMPPREAELLRIEQLLETEDFGAVREATSAARNYPDDAEAWELLGEAYSHQGAEALISLEELLEPFERAIELDPTFSPIYFHPIEAAAALGDSERAYRFLEALDQYGFEEGRPGRYSIFLPLTFGDDATRTEAMQRVRDEVPDRELITGYFYGFRRTPSSVEADLLMARELSRRGVADAAVTLEQSALLTQGRTDEALDLVFHPALEDNAPTRMVLLLQWTAWGGAPDDPRVRALLEADCGRPARIGCYAQAILAADLGAWDRHDEIIDAGEHSAAERITELEAQDPADGDTRGEMDFLRQERLWPDVARAYGAMRRGESTGVPQAFQRARTLQPYANSSINSRSQALRYWTAELLLEQGQAEQAARYYESLWGAPQGAWYTVRLVGLGDAMRAQGLDEEARQHYSEFLTVWSQARDDHPLVVRARAGLEALGG
jgi:tetratricopeptide (TPR) repeat protein/TolB-like protein